MILESLNTMTLIVNLHLKIQILQKWLLDEILIMIKIMLKKMMKILINKSKIKHNFQKSKLRNCKK
jgi:hypothetical protein